MFWKARLVKRLSVDRSIAPPTGEPCESVEIRFVFHCFYRSDC